MYKRQHPIWLEAKAGAEDAGRELGATITWRGPDITDADNMVGVMEEAIEQDYDAIIVYPICLLYTSYAVSVWLRAFVYGI